MKNAIPRATRTNLKEILNLITLMHPKGERMVFLLTDGRLKCAERSIEIRNKRSLDNKNVFKSRIAARFVAIKVVSLPIIVLSRCLSVRCIIKTMLVK